MATPLSLLLARQSGVIARRQVLGLGGTDDDIERLLRRRQWARVHVGVYVDHTGPPAWEQRAWAAVLYFFPAALHAASALTAHGMRGPSGRTPRGRGGEEAGPPIEVAVAEGRRVARLPGVRVTRLRAFDAAANLSLAPPRVRLEVAVLAEASRLDPAAAVALLADACQTWRTTPSRLVTALEAMPRLPQRRLLLAILRDVATGAYSLLEHRYLVEVERPHALPTGVRQHRVQRGSRTEFRDVEYPGQATVVELDGRLGHSLTADRWADLERDLASSADGSLTLRIGWRQVLDPCRLAVTVGRILGTRGWPGGVRGCSPGCPAGLTVR